MFTIFSLFKSRSINFAERHAFHDLINSYAQTQEGAWLNSFQWRAYTIKWCDAMANTDIMGAFSLFMGKKIFLQPSSNPIYPGMPDFWPQSIASTLVHELRHVWQYRNNRPLYILCCLPVVRQITLERDAERVQAQVEEYFNMLDMTRCAADMRVRYYNT